MRLLVILIGLGIVLYFVYLLAGDVVGIGTGDNGSRNLAPMQATEKVLDSMKKNTNQIRDALEKSEK